MEPENKSSDGQPVAGVQEPVNRDEHIRAEILSRVSDAYVALDRDWRYTYVNDQAAALFGSKPEDLIGKHIWTEFPEGIGQPFQLNYERAMREQQPIVFEDYYAPWDRWFENRVYPSPDGVSIFFHEVTERHRLEEQLRHAQRMESVGTLAGGIAHDFNNILTAIIGYAELTLKRLGSADPNRKSLVHILEASDRARHLTRDLLAFSRKQECERIIVDLNEVISTAKKFLLRVIREDIECTIVPYETPLLALADSRQLEQVLLNLATNARDAMPAGGRLTIALDQVNLDAEQAAAHGVETSGSYARISVTDTGAGMDGETRLHIFDPFFTTKEVGKGTGLGLAMVYGIIKQHNGAVVVISKPGEGSTFQLYLPTVAAGSAELAAHQPEELCQRGHETILLAEDDELVREVGSSLLAESGYTIIKAVDGLDAVAKFSQNKGRIDLLLFDLVMPKLNGIAAIDEIRRQCPDVKVIFMTGHADESMLQHASQEHNALLLFKPFSSPELLRKIRAVLDGRLA